jgi:FlgD Ig-like domain
MREKFSSSPEPALQWAKSRLVVVSLLSALSVGHAGATPAEPQKSPVLSVPYKMPTDGELTLGLYDKNGQLLRWLAHGEYRYAGENKEPWDGLDQYGNPVPPGNYTLKAIYHPPITTDYKMSAANPGNPPWPTPDDKGDWLSDEYDSQAAVTDGKWVYLAAPGDELGYSIIAVDETGQRQWGIRSTSSGRAISLALNGNYLYAVYSRADLTDNSRVFTGKNGIGKAVLMCFDKRTGKPMQFTLKQPNQIVATWPYRNDYTWLDELRNNRSFTPAIYGGQPSYYAADVGESTNALGLAAVGSKLYVSLNYDNELLVIDATTGAPNGEEIRVDAPVGLCPLDTHTILAVSGKQVVKVDLGSKAVTPVITSHLVAPDSVTTDKAGNIYVSDWATSFQVKVFTSSGKFLRAIGKEGGRPWVGKWDPSGMLVPRGIAVTDDGRLWVAEDDGSPNRISVWNAQNGLFLKEYIGPTPYGGGTLFWIDPKDRTMVHAEGTAFKADYDRKTYTPLAIDYRRQNRDDPFTPSGHNLDVRQGRILYHDGREYVFSRDKINVILQRKGDVYRPVAAFGNISAAFGNDGTSILVADSFGYHPFKGFFPDSFIGHVGNNYSWTDLNGDNLVQPDEMHWVKTSSGNYQPGLQPNLGAYWGWDVSPNWTYFSAGPFHDQMAIFRLDVKGWTKDGAPIYDMADARPIISLPPKHTIIGLHVTDDKKLIVAFAYEGMGQWNDSTDAIACYDLNGKKLWAIVQPRQLPGREVYANGAQYDFNLPKLGDVFGTWLYHGSQRPYLITTDGLYVGTMLDDTWLGPTSLRGESALYYYQAPDGTPYVINGANQAEHIFQIKGLDQGGRFEGTFQVTENGVKLAQVQRAIPKPVVAPKPVLAVTWLDKPPVIDGDLSDWNLNYGASLVGSNGKTADVALGRDAHNLYLAYRVHESTPPMRNGGADWRTLFVSGDCVDLMVQTDPKAEPHRRTAAPGDERLLLSIFQDKPVAVLYRPPISGTASRVNLASARIDQVIRLDAAKVAIQRDDARGFYTVEAFVPFTALNLDPKTTDDLRGDVGVIYADETGRSRSLRLYYYNHDTALVDDLATEATLQPNEWGKIAMPLGPNLIRNGSFEDPFVGSAQDIDKGWYITRAVNGNYAVITAESPYSGHQSLLLKASTPVSFPPEAYSYPNYGAFVKSANGGKGYGEVEVRQRVMVTPGHQYSVRLQFRSENNLEWGERKTLGHLRGSVSFGNSIDWICPPPSPNRGKRTPIANPYNTNSIYGPVPDWVTVYDPQTFAPSAPYTAPEGAVAADIVFYMRNASDTMPKFFVDNVEFVDVTPGLVK